MDISNYFLRKRKSDSKDTLQKSDKKKPKESVATESRADKEEKNEDLKGEEADIESSNLQNDHSGEELINEVKKAEESHQPINPDSLIPQISLSGKEEYKKNQCDLLYLPHFLKHDYATALYRWCLTELPWHRVEYKARGTTIRTPRWTTVFGRDSIGTGPYNTPPKEIPEVLQQLIKSVQEHALPGSEFNFVLLNFYETGTDSISYHSDDEKFLGPKPTIASFSLGGTREFVMKHKTEGGRGGLAPLKYSLKHGCLLVMRGTTQHSWLHAIPKTNKPVDPRINITLRKAISVAGTNNYYKYNVGGGPIYRYRDGKMVVQDTSIVNNDQGSNQTSDTVQQQSE